MLLINIASIDDDKKEVEQLKTSLNLLTKEYEFLYSVTSFNNAIDFLNSDVKSFDIIFLDIEMPGINGLDLAKSLRKQNILTPIIFLTSFSEYAINSYDVQAMDYILKPINNDYFKLKFKRVLDFIKLKKDEQLSVTDVDREVSIINVSNIAYDEVNGHNCIFYTKNKSYKIRSSLKSIEERLKKFNFIKISNYGMANPRFVKNIVGDDLDLGFMDAHISRSQKKDVINLLTNYLGESF